MVTPPDVIGLCFNFGSARRLIGVGNGGGAFDLGLCIGL